MTLTAEIMGEPAPNVGWTKDGEDIEEDDRRGRGRVARAGPGAGAWAPENRRSGTGVGEVGGEDVSWLISPAQGARKLTRCLAPTLRVFFEIGSTTTTLTVRRATPQDSGKYEVYVENSLGMDQSFARVDVA